MLSWHGLEAKAVACNSRGQTQLLQIFVSPWGIDRDIRNELDSDTMK